LEFPIFLYKRHSTEAFQCPSQEFLDGIKDKEMWQETPWHESIIKTVAELEREYPKLLAKIDKLELIVANFEEESKIKDVQIADLKVKLRFAKKGL
jgi:putative protein kinase ArgK-like GTPase of G3E family